MKRILLTAFIAGFAAFTVNAQDIPERKKDGVRSHQRHGGDRMGMKNLNLTEAQKAEFKKLNEQHRQQMTDLKKQDNITVKESRDRMAKIRNEHKSKVESILTSEQKAQIKKDREDRKQKMQERGRERSEKMKAELGLTDDQSAKLKSNRAEAGAKLKAIREDKSLSDEQRKEKSKEIMKAQKESLKSILTEDQMKKMQERKHKRPGSKDRKDDRNKSGRTI